MSQSTTGEACSLSLSVVGVEVVYRIHRSDSVAIVRNHWRQRVEHTETDSWGKLRAGSHLDFPVIRHHHKAVLVAAQVTNEST